MKKKNMKKPENFDGDREIEIELELSEQLN
jgi:hypothetical protein